jgi:hypothetical protein
MLYLVEAMGRLGNATPQAPLTPEKEKHLTITI